MKANTISDSELFFLLKHAEARREDEARRARLRRLPWSNRADVQRWLNGSILLGAVVLWSFVLVALMRALWK